MYVGYTLIAAVSYIRRLLVYMSAVAVLYTNISMIYIYIYIYGIYTNSRRVLHSTAIGV